MKKELALTVGILTVFLAVSLLPVIPAHAQDAKAVLQTNVKTVLDILRDPRLKGESAKKVKKEKLRAIYTRMFDDVELSRRTLARNWNKLNANERREFVNLFRQVLEKAYMDKILAYTNEKIVYDKENRLSDTQVEVMTRVLTADKEIPIAYRMINSKEGGWRVYDVVIENVSLVQNYRTQFSDILAKQTPSQLLEILRKKVNQQG